MESLQLPPSTIHFNSMPTIVDSHEAFVDRCSEETFDKICQLFVKHDVHNTFGIALTHQHFDLKKDEILAICGNVAVPLPGADSAGKFMASRWAFHDNSVIPYEFTVGGKEVIVEAHRDFLLEFNDLLGAHGLSENIGICTVDSISDDISEPPVEYTTGRANITLPSSITPPGGTNLQASWRVNNGDVPGAKAFAICNAFCRRRSGEFSGHEHGHKRHES